MDCASIEFLWETEECGFSRIDFVIYRSSIALFLNFIIIYICIGLKRNFYFFRVTWKNSYSSAFHSKNREIRFVLSRILLILESVPRLFADSREKLQTDQQESQ